MRFLLVIAFCLCPLLGGCGNDPKDEAPAAKDLTGLGIEDTTEGSGAAAASGQRLRVHYVGKLTDGTQFDSSRDRNQPFEFNLGQGQVIAGWDSGLVGLKVGGSRKLTIPPGLGYGSRGSPPAIPPNATLVFDIELLAIL